MVPGPLIYVDLGLLEGCVVALNILIANRVLLHVDALLQTHQSTRERGKRQVSLAKGDSRRRARALEETHVPIPTHSQTKKNWATTKCTGTSYKNKVRCD